MYAPVEDWGTDHQQRNRSGRDALEEAVFCEGREEVAGWIEGWLFRHEDGDEPPDEIEDEVGVDETVPQVNGEGGPDESRETEDLASRGRGDRSWTMSGAYATSPPRLELPPPPLLPRHRSACSRSVELATDRNTIPGSPAALHVSPAPPLGPLAAQ